MNEKIFRASWILPVTGSPISDGALHIKNGVIAGIGPTDTLIRDNPSIPVESYQNSVLLPAWVNAHCHLELSAFHKKITDFSDFVDWVRQLIALRAQTDQTEVVSKAEQAAIVLRRSGCALVGDVTNGDLLSKFILSDGPERVVLYEILGFNPLNAQTLFETARKRIQKENKSAHLIPHALYSTSAELISLIAEQQEIFSIHIAESPQETEFLKSGKGSFRDFLEERGVLSEYWTPPGVSPIQYLSDLRVLNMHSLLVHSVQVDETDLEQIKDASATVCLCARSNDLLNVGQIPLDTYLRQNISIAIGTDSLASNIDLDMNNEIYYIYKQFNNLYPHDLIRMATLNGARALGKGAEYGSLEVGKRAKFNVFIADQAIGMDPAEFVISKSWSKMRCF